MMQAPFPYFGGKSRAAAIVWPRFGNPANYVEPFAGSLAMLLERPHEPKFETVNDVDAYIANFWRALQREPERVAEFADWPVNEADLTARHLWLVKRREELRDRISTDPDAYDAKVAGYWVWGVCAWIGSGWCAGNGPWNCADSGRWINRGRKKGIGISRSIPVLGSGAGIHRKLPALGSGTGINRQPPHLGRGINSREPTNRGEMIRGWMVELAERLREVRVGDWRRVLGPGSRSAFADSAVFLDPPYLLEKRSSVYSHESNVAIEVRDWAVEHADEPNLRIALCGYDGQYEMPASWTCVHWKANGGYGARGIGNGRRNAGREIIWFSPQCLSGEESVASQPAPNRIPKWLKSSTRRR